MKIISNEEAANVLDVPSLAMGQILFDSKLKMVGIFQFDEEAVLSLRENEPQYLESLRGD